MPSASGSAQSTASPAFSLQPSRSNSNPSCKEHRSARWNLIRSAGSGPPAARASSGGAASTATGKNFRPLAASDPMHRSRRCSQKLPAQATCWPPSAATESTATRTARGHRSKRAQTSATNPSLQCSQTQPPTPSGSAARLASPGSDSTMSSALTARTVCSPAPFGRSHATPTASTGSAATAGWPTISPNVALPGSSSPPPPAPVRTPNRKRGSPPPISRWNSPSPTAISRPARPGCKSSSASATVPSTSLPGNQ